MAGRPMTEEMKQKLAVARRAAAARKKAEAAETEIFPKIAPEYGSAVEGDEAAVLSPADPNPAGPYDLFLATLDEDTRALFSSKELKELFAEQQQKALEEKKAAARKTAREKALTAARAAAGMVPQTTLEAIQTAKHNAGRTRVLIQLPPADEQGNASDDGLRIDQRVLLNGRWHECTVGERASILENLYRTGQMEMEFEGRSIRRRRFQLGNAMGNAPRSFDMEDAV